MPPPQKAFSRLFLFFENPSIDSVVQKQWQSIEQLFERMIEADLWLPGNDEEGLAL